MPNNFGGRNDPQYLVAIGPSALPSDNGKLIRRVIGSEEIMYLDGRSNSENQLNEMFDHAVKLESYRTDVEIIGFTNKRTDADSVRLWSAPYTPINVVRYLIWKNAARSAV